MDSLKKIGDYLWTSSPYLMLSLFGIGGGLLLVLFVANYAKIVGLDTGDKNAPLMICPNCGTRSEAKIILKGSTTIEVVLWLCYILPGLIYSIWRRSPKQLGCPSCGQIGMINVNSPQGRILVEKYYG